jgi:biopolymer transport protein ExbD
MIDVLLVLLIIFMLAQNVRHAIDVQVPPLAAQPVGPAPTQIVLELLPGTGYAINGQPVPDDRLEAVLGQIYGGRASKLLFVKAAPDRIYQDVVAAMDRSRGIGVQVIAKTFESTRSISAAESMNQ